MNTTSKTTLIVAALAALGAPAAHAASDPGATWPPANSGCGEEGPTMSTEAPTMGLSSAELRLRDTGRVRAQVQGDQTAATTVTITQADSSREDDLVGRRVRVKDGVEQLLINTRPNEEFIGSLSAGQTFKVSRLSPAGKYAYGFGYGTANKTGWILASDLERP
ncbi:MAG: hypothetical protein MSC31_17075 [Solirubrobacteraceae bacterium MAG38_C4-C5]|nr:hypothetical protein [Candidatus Siliceabacter maunaloa]